MAENTQSAPQEPTGTPEHQARLQAAKDHREKVLKQKAQNPAKEVEVWIEVQKRVSNEVGKVIKKTKTDSGMTHSFYVGRENKCLSFLKEQLKNKVPVYMGGRYDEYGRDGVAYKLPKGA